MKNLFHFVFVIHKALQDMILNRAALLSHLYIHSILSLFGYRPIKEGCFTAEMFLPRNITEPLPLIVNTPPMQSPYSFRTYREVNRKVASYGFMTIVSAEENSRRGWMSEVKIGNRGIQLKQFIEAQNEKPESLLYQKYSGKAGVWGMSMVRLDLSIFIQQIICSSLFVFFPMAIFIC